jgi:hypothetical protein
MIRLAPVLVAALILLAFPAAAGAQAEVPGQDAMDQPGSMSNGNWSDLPGGATARPYVKSLTVVNGSQSTPVFSGGVGAAAGVQNGDVTAVVMPFNLCRAGQPPAPGQCYATPNRVGVTLGYKTAMGLGRDFSRPSVALRQAAT